MLNEFVGGNYKVLSGDSIYKIHMTSLDIMENIGFSVDDQDLLNLLEKTASLPVDHERKTFKVPEYLVKEAIKKSPSNVKLCARDPSCDLMLDGNRVHLGTGGTALYVLDSEGVRRDALIEDVQNLGRLADALSNIHFFHIPVYPSDISKEMAGIHRFHYALKNTAKHITGSGYTTYDLDEAVKMASIILGGYEEVTKRPIISFIVCPIISPLRLEKHFTRMLIHAVRTGIPTIISIETQSGSTGPVTLAGNLALQNAETLCGIVIAQSFNPGAPVLYGTVASIADPRTAHFLSGPIEMGILNAAGVQMSHYYGLPIYATGGMSDSKIPDAQAGYEKASTVMLTALAGGNFIHDAAGLLEFSLTVSYEQMVIDNEILGMTLRAVRGIDVSDEALALDVIREVGPGGIFLSHPHTSKHIRSEFYFPGVSDRRDRQVWETDAKDTWNRASEIVGQILKKYEVRSLPKDTSEELDKNLQKAMKKYGTT